VSDRGSRRTDANAAIAAWQRCARSDRRTIADPEIIQYRKQPEVQIGSGLPPVLFGRCPREATLNQVVGRDRVARHGAGIPTQAVAIGAQANSRAMMAMPRQSA